MQLAEKWRRCATCRKVRPVEDFSADEAECQACQAKQTKQTTTRGGGPAPVTTRVAAVGGGTGGGVNTATTVPVRDLKGRGDPEVRARRARVRALDRLVEQHPDDFALLLAEERRAERL